MDLHNWRTLGRELDGFREELQRLRHHFESLRPALDDPRRVGGEFLRAYV